MILAFAWQQSYRDMNDIAKNPLRVDWAYVLHLFVVTQCCLLTTQAVLCLLQLQVSKKVPKHNSLGQRDLDPNQSFINDSNDPRVIIIIPCWREEPSVLKLTLDSIVACNYPRSKLQIYLSFDGLDQRKQADGIKELFYIFDDTKYNVPEEFTYETSFKGCNLILSVFEHGGKRYCQKRTFEQLTFREERSLLIDSFVLLLDSDTFLRKDCIVNFVLSMKSQPSQETQYQAMSGITKVFEPHRSLIHHFQRLEYFYSQRFERAAEAACGAVHCLPGGLTMLTYRMLEAVAAEYFNDSTTTQLNWFEHMKRNLGEDRWLTQLTTKYGLNNGRVGLCSNAVCDTVVPATIAAFLAQRKRWFLGCIANEACGMSDIDAWKNYPMLSAFRLAAYAVGTPGFPLILTRYNVLRNTPYFRPNLGAWAFAVFMTWVTLIITADREELPTALLYPAFFVLNPVQLIVAKLYAIFTIGRWTWGTRTSPFVNPPFPEKVKRGLVMRQDSLRASDTRTLVAELKLYLRQTRPNCSQQVMSILGTGSQAGEVACVLSDGIAVARKRALSPRSKAGRAILQEIRILSRLSHDHVISLIKAQQPSLNLEILLWPVAPCDLMKFLSSVHEVEAEGPIPTDIWHSLGFAYGSSPETSLSEARKWLCHAIGCLCSAVAYIHDQDIWHHDIRTQNVLVTARGPVLIDFGGAVDLKGMRGFGEVSDQELENYHAADVRLLGCVLLDICSAVVAIDPRANDSFNVLTNLSQTLEWNFVTNVGQRSKWIKEMYNRSDHTITGILDVVQKMLKDEAAQRASASNIVRELTALKDSSLLFGNCCNSFPFSDQI